MKIKILLVLLLNSSLVSAQTETKLFEVYTNKSGQDVRLEAVRNGDQVLFKKTEGGQILSENQEEEEEKVVVTEKRPTVSDFYISVSKKNYVAIEEILSKGTSADSKLYAGSTALHMASSWNDKKMLDLLLTHNGNIKAQNNKGEMPVHLACGYGSIDLLKSIALAKTVKNFSEELNKKTKQGRTCMHYLALYSRNNNMAKYVASLKPDFKLKDESGQNPGHFAATTDNWSILLDWVQLGAIPLQDKDNFDMTVENYIMKRADIFTKAKFLPYLTEDNKIKIQDSIKKISINN